MSPPVRRPFLMPSTMVAACLSQVLAQQTPPALAATWEGHRGSVHTICVAPDGKRAATASEDGTIRVWHVATGNCATVCQDKDRIWAVAFLPKGDTLVSGGFDGRLTLWDADDGTKQVTFGPEPDGGRGITCVAVSADGKHALTGGFDSKMRLWDLNERTVAAEWSGHSDTVWAVAFGPTPDHVVSGSFDGALRLVNRRSGQCEAVLAEEDVQQRGWKRAVVVGRDQRTLLVAGASTPREWNVTTRESLSYAGEPHTASSVSIAVSPDGSITATGGFDGHIHLWDNATRRCITRWNANQGDGVWATAFLPDGRLLTAGNTGTIKVWAAATKPPR